MAGGEKRYHLSAQLEQEIISLAKRNRIEKLYHFPAFSALKDTVEREWMAVG